MLLISGIVVLHTPPIWPRDALPPEAHAWPGLLKVFLEWGPLRAGVPTLSLISGYLLFVRPERSYAGLLRRKLVTLMVPFLAWNAITLGLHALTGGPVLGLPAGDPGWLASLATLLENPPDYPTYFLPDLFVCAALAPVIGLLMRRLPLATLLAGVGAVALGYAPIPTVRPDVALAFAAGAALALHRVDHRRLDRYRLPILAGFLLVCAASIGTLIFGPPGFFRLALLRALGVPAAWALSGALARTRAGDLLAGWSRAAFLLFCAHWPLLHLLAGAWPEGLGYWSFYALAAPLIIVAVLGLGRVLEGRGGLGWRLLTGSRRLVAPPADPFRRPEAGGNERRAGAGAPDHPSRKVS